MQTQLEKRLTETAEKLLSDSADMLNVLAGMTELLSRRMPGLKPEEQSLLKEHSEFCAKTARERQDDLKRLKSALPGLQSPEFPLN